ncbi:hypothetical protein ABKN59_002478 [Abortiporus biennis]
MVPKRNFEPQRLQAAHSTLILASDGIVPVRESISSAKNSMILIREPSFCRKPLLQIISAPLSSQLDVKLSALCCGSWK